MVLDYHSLIKPSYITLGTPEKISDTDAHNKQNYLGQGKLRGKTTYAQGISPIGIREKMGLNLDIYGSRRG